MNVRKQKCAECHSAQLNNVLVQEDHGPVRVFVYCPRCRSFVARYELSNYFERGQMFEQYLRFHRADEAETGRQWLEEFQKAQQEAEAGFQQVRHALEEEGEW